MKPPPIHNHFSTPTRPCARWGPASTTLTMKNVFFHQPDAARFVIPCLQDHFFGPSAETDSPGISLLRIFSTVFHPVDGLNVATMSQLFSSLAVKYGGPHSTLMYHVLENDHRFDVLQFDFFELKKTLIFVVSSGFDFYELKKNCNSKKLPRHIPVTTPCLDPDLNLQVMYCFTQVRIRDFFIHHSASMRKQTFNDIAQQHPHINTVDHRFHLSVPIHPSMHSHERWRRLTILFHPCIIFHRLIVL